MTDNNRFDLDFDDAGNDVEKKAPNVAALDAADLDMAPMPQGRGAIVDDNIWDLIPSHMKDGLNDAQMAMLESMAKQGKGVAEVKEDLAKSYRKQSKKSLDGQVISLAGTKRPMYPGTKGETALEALQNSGGDITAKLEPLGFLNGGYDSGHLRTAKACINAETGHLFGVVGEGWSSMGEFIEGAQHRDIAAMVDEAIKNLESDKELVECFSSPFADRVWWSIPLNQISKDDILNHPRFDVAYQAAKSSVSASFCPPDDLDLQFRLIVHHALGGKGTLDIGMLMNVCACSNLSRVDVGGIALKMKHGRNFAPRVDRLRKAFQKTGGLTNQLVGEVAAMVGTPVERETFEDFTERLLGSSERADSRRRREMLELAYMEADGALPNTVWGMQQAGTYYTTHLLSNRLGGRSASKFRLDMADDQKEAYASLESSMFGTGHQKNVVARNYCLDLIG